MKKLPNIKTLSFWSRKSAIQITLLGAKKPNIDIPDQPPTPQPIETPPRVAIVLGGGGARGFAHIGILKVLSEAKIPIDLVVGTSVGALIGALYCDDFKNQQLENELKQIRTYDLLDLAILKLRAGLFTGRAIQNYLLNKLEARDFKALKKKFVVTTVDINTSEHVILESGPIAPAVNASCALPPFFHPVQLYGRALMDGGLIDPVPVSVAKRYDPLMIIACDVSSEAVPASPKNFLTRFVRGYDITLAELGHEHAHQADVDLEPDVKNISLFDFKQKITAYQAGIDVANQQLGEIKRILSQKLGSISQKESKN